MAINNTTKTFHFAPASVLESRCLVPLPDQHSPSDPSSGPEPPRLPKLLRILAGALAIATAGVWLYGADQNAARAVKSCQGPNPINQTMCLDMGIAPRR